MDKIAARRLESTVRMISVTIDSPNTDIGAQWDDLVRRASSNVFMHPAALRAACETDFAAIRMLLAWEEGAAGRRLVGVWGLRLRKIAPLWPGVLEALPYDYAFLSSPVVDPAFIEQVIPAFLLAIEQDPRLPNIVSLKSFDAECPGYAVMLKLLARRGIQPLILSESARPFATPEAGMKRSGSTRKKLRQDWNRLSALGSIEIVNDLTPQGVQEAFETFLFLEQASWKGARGTALLSDVRDATFVRRLLQRLAASGSASVALLRVEGRAIAAQVLMYCGTTAYTWKTAFDANFGKYSPGSLLIDKITEQLFAGAGTLAMNSCAAETSFMAHLWTGRRKMVDLLIDVGSKGSWGFRLEAARQQIYEMLRAGRHRLRSRTRASAPKKLGLVPSEW